MNNHLGGKRHTVDEEIFVAKNFLVITFNDENQIGKIFSSTYKWSKFILSSGHSDKNKARRKFNSRKYFTAEKFLICDSCQPPRFCWDSSDIILLVLALSR